MILKILKEKRFYYYTIAIILGILNGLYGNSFSVDLAGIIAGIFINLFKFVAVPLILFSIITTISGYEEAEVKNKIWQNTALYTFGTTLAASVVAFLIYIIVNPVSIVSSANVPTELPNTGYIAYITGIIPNNFISPFLENKVISMLFIGIAVGVAIRFLPHNETKTSVVRFFKGVHGIITILTSWIVAIIPIGLFGFITQSVIEFKGEMNVASFGEYLSIVISANLIQGLVILPLWLKMNKISPIKHFRGMSQAVGVAFLTKSSVGTMPITISNAENNLKINPKIARFVLPLCTVINMNGCAAFIFATSIFIMQSNGIEVSFPMMLLWILISVIAAIGNAGVPMGCFFLTASLLVSMNVPLNLLMLILPFYAVIDAIETALNVWSDSCVVAVVDKNSSL